MIGYKMKQAKQAGAKLIVVDPRRTELAEEADYWLQIKPGTDIPLLNSICLLYTSHSMCSTMQLPISLHLNDPVPGTGHPGAHFI